MGDFMSFTNFLQRFHLLFLALLPVSLAASATVVDSLPGFPGKLPFRLETGYIGVGKEEEVELFYYFIESERDPKRDPLLIWFTGGPGCSSLSSFFFENGPMNLNYSNMSWQSEVPNIKLNPSSWTKVASIIFLDSPVYTGFSYVKSREVIHNDDITASMHAYEFLRKWLVEHVEFQKNPLYISGSSYSGITVPIIVQEVLNGNKAGILPLMNLKGYILGNPHTTDEDAPTFEYARRMSLLSDELYKETKANCGDNYNSIDAKNSACLKNLQLVSTDMDALYGHHIIEASCNTSSFPPKLCRDNAYELISTWANNLKVQEALHIRRGTIIRWSRCNRTMPYTESIKSSLDYHRNLTKERLHALVYSGDQDLVVSYVGTQAWIKKLKLSVIDRWRPWFGNGQVAGYTTKYSNGHYQLTFATVKGAGHTPPEFKPRECFGMFKKWSTRHTL